MTQTSGASRRENAKLYLPVIAVRGATCPPKLSRHHPRKRVIQYPRDASDGIEKPRRTGYPAFAGYDDRWVAEQVLFPFVVPAKAGRPGGYCRGPTMAGWCENAPQPLRKT